MNVTVDDLRSFYDELANHDWYFDYSDDGRVWDRGRRERDHIIGMIAKNAQFKELYHRFADWVYQRAPEKPPRP